MACAGEESEAEGRVTSVVALGEPEYGLSDSSTALLFEDMSAWTWITCREHTATTHA